MVFDRTEHEPDEDDPEADFRDPDSDSLTIPRVETEDAGSGLGSELREEFESEAKTGLEEMGEESDVPPALLKTFWAVVLVVNGAVLAFALGLMLILFQGDLSRGGALIVGGGVLLAFAARRYRGYRRSSDESERDTEKSTAEASENTGGEDPADDEPRQSENSDDA
ncbi:DUF7322 domain-containing protein [Salinadaptatus halalkaliphilus]|uniref:DUF7322 domain-containing protein n=1 Tax=Salinadaptatus halalkaliphilus TaxID=2419781 RepID=UPI0015809208|nr:hypothetical protein [Salinadaptatus halalkaliphilus]